MIIKLRGKSVEMTPAMKGHIENELIYLEKYGRLISSDDIFRVETHVYSPDKVKVTINGALANSRRIGATAKGSDFYKAVCKATRQLEKQLRRLNNNVGRKNKPKGHRFAAKTEVIEIEV